MCRLPSHYGVAGNNPLGPWASVGGFCLCHFCKISAGVWSTQVSQRLCTCYRLPVSVPWSQRRFTELPLAKGACFNSSKLLSPSELMSGPEDRLYPFCSAFISYSSCVLLRNESLSSVFLPISEMCMGLKHIITFPTQLITQVFLSGHQVNMASFLSMAPKYFPVSSVGSFLWFVSGFTSLLLNVFISTVICT